MPQDVQGSCTCGLWESLYVYLGLATPGLQRPCINTMLHPLKWSVLGYLHHIICEKRKGVRNQRDKTVPCFGFRFEQRGFQVDELGEPSPLELDGERKDRNR